MLAREFAGQVVEPAHALDGDEERLVGGETGCLEPVDLAAQMILELVDVAAGDGVATADIGAPRRDLLFEAGVEVGAHAGAPPSAKGLRPSRSDHTCWSALLTTLHCRRCSAKASCPLPLSR